MMPIEVGGSGVGTLGGALLEEQFTRASGAMAAVIPQPSNILLACNEEQKGRYLLPAVRGEKTDCFALTEVEAGSDAGNIKTSAIKQGSKWILNGTKRFISHGDIADFAVLFAVSDPNGPKATAFLIDKGTPGFSVGQMHKTMGYMGYRQAELLLDNCEVPEENVLGQVDKGFDLTRRWLTNGRILNAARCLGPAERAITLAREYANQRVQFGQPIGEFEGIQFMMADCATQLFAARWMTYKIAWDADQQISPRDLNEKAAMVKLFAAEMLGFVADTCLQVHGGTGYMRDSSNERIYRDARIERIWEGTSEVQKWTIGKALMKRGTIHF
jgi:acyl-CoA dehydrogenase